MSLGWGFCVRAGFCIALATAARPAAADTALELAPVVVTATRVAQSSADIPASIDVVGRDTIANGQLQENLSESLLTVPGVSAQSRQNYAQDLQISMRGFGARSSFGVRGVRLYSDGIPGTMPDGQGQFSQFDLGSADHIEVLRGPLLGVVRQFLRRGHFDFHRGCDARLFRSTARPQYGTFNTQRYALVQTTGAAGPL